MKSAVMRYAGFLLAASACGNHLEQGPIDTAVTRQALLGTSWTGPWGASTPTFKEVGMSGKRSSAGGGTFVWTTMFDGGVSANDKFSDTNATWYNVATGYEPALGRIAVAPTMESHGCELIAFRHPQTNDMIWDVEPWDSSFGCLSSPSSMSGRFTLGAELGSAPAIASYVVTGSPDTQHYWAFGASTSGNCSGGACYQWNHYSGSTVTGGGWTTWTERTDGTLKSGSAPAAVARSAGTVDLFVVGTGSGAWWQPVSISGSTPTWSGFQSLGGTFTSDLAAASSGSSNLEVCGRGQDNAIWCSTYNGSSWSGFSSCGGTSNSAPTVAIDSGGNLIVCTLGTADQVYCRRCNSADR